MSIIEIKAIGNLLLYYYTDLNYINEFRRYRLKEIPFEKYLLKEPGTFKSFINEFKVARNFEKTKTEYLLNLITKWLNDKHFNNVNGLANYLKNNGLTGVNAVSLSSKILFLNDPSIIFPLDSNVKNALGITNNNYEKFYTKVNSFLKNNYKKMSQLLDDYDRPLSQIENEFHSIGNLKTIRINRFTDKLLWTIGKNGTTVKEIYNENPFFKARS